ncbi:MAG TPA: hypothetical protein VNV66_06850 [Pilimelia sp.]|nr:hypothetical protein [Pilimelia sp.]
MKLSLRAALPLAVAGLIGGLLTGAPANAAASAATPADRPAAATAAAVGAAATAEWVLPAKRLKTFKWYQGGGSCWGESRATYYAGDGSMRLYSKAWSTAPLHGCRVAVTLTIDAGGQRVTVVRDLPTTCSGSDPTCNETRDEFYDIGLPPNVIVQVSNYYMYMR